MAKIAVVYWSETGNTEAMARHVAEGVDAAGGTFEMIPADAFGPDDIGRFDAIAFGCPAMGDEVLEEDTFEPMFSSVEGLLSGKRVGLFGSYDWGDGEWMRTWAERCRGQGALLVNDGVISNLYPSDSDAENCRCLGRGLCG